MKGASYATDGYEIGIVRMIGFVSWMIESGCPYRGNVVMILAEKLLPDELNNTASSRGMFVRVASARDCCLRLRK